MLIPSILTGSVRSRSLWLIHVKRGCRSVSLSPPALVCICFEASGQGRITVGSEQRERKKKVAAKFYPTQQKQNKPPQAEQPSDAPPFGPTRPPPHLKTTSPPPRLPLPSPSSPAVWHTEPALAPACTCVTLPAKRAVHTCHATRPCRECFSISAHSTLSTRFLPSPPAPGKTLTAPGFSITISLITAWVCDREC